MLTKILIDFEEYQRLQLIEEKYNELRQQQNKNKSNQDEQTGNGPPLTFNESSSLVPPTMEVIDSHNKNQVFDNDTASNISEHPLQFEIQPTTFVMLRESLKPRAKKLLQRVMASEKAELEVLHDGRVKIDGKIIDGSNIANLLAATYYPKKKAVGKEEWLSKLKQMNFLKTKSVATLASHSAGKNWWYIGE